MTILLAAFASSSDNSFVGVLVFLVGAVLFFLGFRAYRKYRLLRDTPLVPVRSVAMGLAHVRGKLTGDGPLTSPLTQQPCFYYSVAVQKWVGKSKERGSEWESVGGETECRMFYVDDGTGKALVDPSGAELDASMTFQAEIGRRGSRNRYVDSSLGTPGPSDQDLRDYLAAGTAQLRSALDLLQSGKLLQTAVPKGAEEFVGAVAKGAEKVLGAMQKFDRMGLSIGGGGLRWNPGGPIYRFTEHCLLAGHDCIVMGTCVENPAPKDEHDRNLIKKGQNEKTFLITTKTERQEEKALRKQALILILVGAAAMIAIVATFLHIAGLFRQLR